MATTFIQPKNNEKSKVIRFLHKHVRNFEQKVIQVINETTPQTEEIKEILRNKDYLDNALGGASRVKDLVVNLPMIFGGATRVKFNTICGATLAQDLQIILNHKQFHRNCSMYLSGQLLQGFAYHDEFKFMNNLYHHDSPIFNYQLQWNENDGELSVAINAPRIERPNWYESILLKATKPLEEEFKAMLQYLAGGTP